MQNLMKNFRCDAPLLQLLSIPNLRNVEPKVPNLPMENIAMQLGSVWCTKLCDDAVLCSARPILRFFNMRQMHKNLYHISHTTTDAPNSFPPFCIRMMHGDIYVSSHANCQTIAEWLRDTSFIIIYHHTPDKMHRNFYHPIGWVGQSWCKLRGILDVNINTVNTGRLGLCRIV